MKGDGREWMPSGNCHPTKANLSPEARHAIFFPHIEEDSLGRRVFRRNDYLVAMQYCSTCPVSVQCYNYAQEIGVDYGMWGGLSPRSRRRQRSLEEAS